MATPADKRMATEIIPIEVWNIILTQLDNPEDLYAAHNSCNTFGNLLHSRRSEFLFPLVFPILVETGHAKDDEFPLKFDNQFLSTRLACTFWKSGVDIYLKKLSYLSSSRKEYPPIDPFKFYEHKGVQMFLEKMTTHTSKNNPFFNGLVSFDDEYVDLDELLDFWNEVSFSFLPKFGKHILYGKIFHGTADSVQLGYPVLFNILRHTPALRFLEVCSFTKEYYDLRDQISQAPLPYFKNLKILHVVPGGISVTHELLRAATTSQLQEIEVDLASKRQTAHFNSSFSDFLTQLPSLKNVTLPRIRFFSSLIKLCSSNWAAISRLSLAVKLDRDAQRNMSDKISHGRLFKALSSLKDGGSIRSLTLELTGFDWLGRDLRLSLPFLEDLTLVADGQTVNVNSLDFVVVMESLKNLSICVPVQQLPSKKNMKELVRFSGFVANMKNSNIWTILPSLEKLSFGYADHPDYVYHR